MKEPKVKSIISKCLGIFTCLLFVLAIAIIIVGINAYKNNKPTKIFGYIYSVVPTDSMEPVINEGDFILSKEVPFEKLTIGDDIIYYSKSNKIYIVHRIVDVNLDGSFIMKGVNNSTFDTEFVTKENYVGKVVKVLTLFKIGGLIANHRSLIFLILMLLFFFLLIIEIGKMFITIKEEKIASQNKKNDEEKQKFIEAEREKIKKEILEDIKKEKGKITEK
mgnify:FL=1